MAGSVEAVVNRQILKWEQASRATTRELREMLGSKPLITLSSAYGSRGWEVGRQVAEMLDFDFFDRELVEKIAASANVRQRLVESLDERAQDWITEHITRQFEQEVFSTSDFLRHLSRVVLTISQHGRAVVVGRGSQFILRPESTLRVRTTAPLDARIRAVAELDGLGAPDARALVLRRDAERAAFARLHFNHDVSQPEHYDLVLNTAALDPAQAAELVHRAFALRFGG